MFDFVPLTFWTPKSTKKIKIKKKIKLEFGMYPQSMPTEWTHARTVRPWQSVRLKKIVNRRLDLRGL